ncbi:MULTISPECIES: DUF5313 family protein [unclassified Rhodococcus (in: high G+C Gram-positive bacteria)]|uniref:DUF5313 family protein n=1 Tax=unclassified Rhodococcus (in: high G+C Gram-positive bacteria) TaxID=192944 RepID=UPI00146F8D27|nr:MULTISPECIES: DUF5313 family protein [unclassified Rhodococcus (in: high G+C Gram-positive bacteria)]MBF0662296.1 DUF5313 family protein [Rhodococcus sp. (in: high G+C Gram-positive bacteria)]NME79541.1 DUF5313 domain-containing protein [Rhodococcus sp. 105337]
MSSARPNLFQRLGYMVGRTLPPEMREWVRNDILGPGGARRYLLRWNLPIIPPLMLFLLIPGPVWIPFAMMLLLFLPWVYFSAALMPVWQRHRLQQHGIDPELLSEKARNRAAREREDYERRMGRAV